MLIKSLCLISVLVSTVSCSNLKEHFSGKLQTKRFTIKKKWVRNTLTKEHLGYRHPHRMSPLVFDDFIVQGNAIDGIGSYDRSSGNERWKINVKGGVEAGAVADDKVLYFGGSDGRFYAVDVLTGQLKWVFPVNSEVLSTPTLNKDTIYFIAGNNRIYALNKDSGKQLWMYSRRETSTLSIRGGSTPRVAGEHILLGFSDGYVVALNKSSGKVIWAKALNSSRRFRDVDSSPVVDGERVFVSGFDDALYCLERTTGKILWRHDRGGFSAVTTTNDHLFYATTEGDLQSLDKNSGKVIWSYKVKKGLATQPELYRGLLVFGEYEGDLKALEADSGRVVGKFSPGRGIMSAPSLDLKTGDLYFLSVDANLHAMKLTWQRDVEKWPWED